MIKVLLQTTIPATEDDWHIGRYSLLRDYLTSLKDESGRPQFAVTARDREPDGNGHDPVLGKLGDSDFDEVWLFGADLGNGLSGQDCAGVSAFRRRGGGILATRDHQDAGASLCTIGGVGAAHYFHTRNLDPDEARRAIDDTETKSISWPNYHSGSNGDYQRINIADPAHPVLRRHDGGAIEFFPAHPHEGGVGAPANDPTARVVATGKSTTTGRPFNLIVAFEAQPGAAGRALAHSSFHHFADYNWDTATGCPSFVEEAPGDGLRREPRALADIKEYVRNAAVWLAGGETK